MAKYQQTYTYTNEDGFGSNTIKFVVSDDYNTLVDESTAIEVDIFILEKLKKDFKDDNGGLVQDDLSIMSADYFVKNTDEQNCLNLINSAITTKVYCAILFNPNDPVVGSDVLFTGIIDPDIQSEAVNWDRDEYASSSDIVKTYKYSAAPEVENLLDDIKIKDVLDDIPNDWKTANVADRQAWRNYSKTVGLVTEELNTYVCDLVSLNKLMRAIGDRIEVILNAGGGSYNVHFNRVKFTGKYAPARWRVSSVVDPYWGEQLWVDGRQNNSNGVTGNSRPPASKPDVPVYHNLDDGTDYKNYYLDPDAVSEDENETVFVDYKYFRNLSNPSEYNDSQANSFRVGGDDSSVTDFFYSFAENFNFLLSLRIDKVNEDIYIDFINGDYLASFGALYFKDASKYKLDLSIEQGSNNKDEYKTESFYGVGEEHFGKDGSKAIIYGRDKYGVSKAFDNSNYKVTSHITSGSPRKNKYTEDKSSGKSLLLSISPTLAMMKPERGTMLIPPQLSLTYLRPPCRNGDLLPHNIKITHKYTYDTNPPITVNMNQMKGDGWMADTRSVHTGLYVKIASKETYEPDAYFTPIRRMAVKIDNTECGFDLLEDYLSVSKDRYIKFSKQDVDLSIPYWNAFSENSDGSNPSLKLLKLGKKITLNSVDYVINSIEIDFSKPEVNLKLKQNTLFSEIQNPSIPKNDDEFLGEEDTYVYDDSVEYKEIVGACLAYSALAVNTDNKLVTIVDHSKLDTYYGLALEDGGDNLIKVIKAPGKYILSDIPFTAGDTLYLKVDGSLINISANRLKRKASTLNCVNKVIGKLINSNTLQLFDNEHFYYD